MRIAGLSCAFATRPEEGAQPYNFNDSMTIDEAFYNVLFRGFSEVYPESYVTSPEGMAHRITETTELGVFFQSRKGYLGLMKGDIELHPTDLICVLLGANVPFIIRRVHDHYILLSDAYVEGLMHGEAIELTKKENLVVETIDIH